MDEKPSTELRDYFGRDGIAKVTVLADFEGPTEERGVGYRIGDRLVRTNNEFFSAVTGVPQQFRENWSLLRDPMQRRLLARALVDDSLMTQQRRKAILSLLMWGALVVALTVAIVLAIVNREALGFYQSALNLFVYSLLTSLFLPTPFELLLMEARSVIGTFWTVLVASVAKVAGAWIVLMAGDRVGAGIEAFVSKGPRLRRAWNKTVALAQRWGYAFVYVVFSIPLMTDTVPLFLLAVMNLRKSIFLAVTFAAIVTRSLLWIFVGNIFDAL